MKKSLTSEKKIRSASLRIKAGTSNPVRDGQGAKSIPKIDLMQMTGPRPSLESLAAKLGGMPNASKKEAGLSLQRTRGNSFLQEMAAKAAQADSDNGAIAGLKPIGEEEEFLGGRTIGEALGDVGRPIKTALGNIIGSIAGAFTRIKISTTTNVGPTWSNHGLFRWQVGFNTTGTNGWIVQKVVNTYRAQNAAGAPAPGARPTPMYWEAWSVDAASNVIPANGPDNDYWLRPSKGPGTEGHWSMTGTVYFTNRNPATQGFAPGGVPDAGILLSTTTEPTGLGISRLHRYAQGTWDSTGAHPIHTGSARP